ncbi:ribosomal protein-like protein [Wolffia australiana]
MEQPTQKAVAVPPSSPLPSPLSSSSGPAPGSGQMGPAKKPAPPTPEELVAHYEAQGLEPREASLRVIRELQTVLYRTVASGRGKKDRFMADAGRKLDNANARLALVEMKLDSKPGYPEAFAVAVCAGAAVNAVGASAPFLLGGLRKLWETVSGASKGHSPPSP